MTKPHWVIDSVDVVHHRFCQMIFEDATTYHTKPETNAEMIEHLARPDVKDRHHKASVLDPCDQCVLGLPLEEE